MIEKLSWKAMFLLCSTLAIPISIVGYAIRQHYGFTGNLVLASAVIVVGVPWAFYSSRRDEG